MKDFIAWIGLCVAIATFVIVAIAGIASYSASRINDGRGEPLLKVFVNQPSLDGWLKTESGLQYTMFDPEPGVTCVVTRLNNSLSTNGIGTSCYIWNTPLQGR